MFMQVCIYVHLQKLKSNEIPEYVLHTHAQVVYT